VYVFDTGVDATHPDFGGRVTTGYSVIPGYAANKDCHGHGTHVAGTVGGTTYGVAKEVTIVPIKVLACDGSGSVQGIINAIDDWVLPRHVAGTKAIANFSLGGSSTSASLVAAINRLHAAGIPSVVAAGNSNKDACGFSPANASAAVTVGATDLEAQAVTGRELEAMYSNFGPCIDLFAPGTGIESARTGGGSQRMSGTSMAAPHVAGAIAVAWESRSTLTGV
jgi:subtilisin family serine protease